MNNSMAISAKGDVYMWGKTGSGLMNQISNTSFRLYPVPLHLDKKYKFYKAIHVSLGLLHAAIIMECQLSKLVETKKQPTELVISIIQQQRKKIDKLEIDVLDHFNG